LFSFYIDLIDSGYQILPCRLYLSRSLFHQGLIVRARTELNACLHADPNFSDALQFKQMFDAQVKKGKYTSRIINI
jgi:hypothetical protein